MIKLPKWFNFIKSEEKLKYPDFIINETRNALLDFDNSGLKGLQWVFMKTIEKEFGYILVSDIKNNVWNVRFDNNSFIKTYQTLDELLDYGWVID